MDRAWELEVSDEVKHWLTALEDKQRDRARFHIEELRASGAQLSRPHARRLSGKLWELQFGLDKQAIRITYCTMPGRVIVLLTVFRKQRQREPREIQRAKKAMAAWTADKERR